MAEAAQAADDDMFLGQVRPQLEQAMGQGQTALWTLPLVATQYQPLQPTSVMQQALRAQNEGRFLDALILLDEAGKSGQAGADSGAKMDLLRASFLLQGNQSQQALEILAPLLAQTRYAADAYALTAMAYLQQGKIQQALESAQHARNSEGGILPHLALSYVLQGAGRLPEAREAMHDFNTRMPQAVTLAREAELDLTLGRIQPAKALVRQAEGMDAAHTYVIAVSGLVRLIDGQSVEAKAAFETALRRDPKDAKALLGLGLAEIKLGNFQAGQKKLQAADEAEPGNALILTYLGRAQQQAGQTVEAMASWRSAQRADPKDPTPWLYQAQAELQANRLTEARESLRQAQARSAYRAVYRGANLLHEDEQLLQANLAEIQRRSGLEGLAFHTLSDPVGEKNAANLRNQADLLQGQRFGESARRSLLLQSLFSERPGNLPPEQDIYGDGAGQTGASSPQHGAVSGLHAQQSSYNNYDELFNRRTVLEADAVTGNQNTNGEQVRLGVGNGTLGLGFAYRQYKTSGNAPFENLDNRIAQATVQWRPAQSTQMFLSSQTFDSQHGETFLPAAIWGGQDTVVDSSRIMRLGLRHDLTGSSELRALWSSQQTDQTINRMYFIFPTVFYIGSSSTQSAELQYLRSGAGYATKWGIQYARGQYDMGGLAGIVFNKFASTRQQVYAAWQQDLNPYWQLEAGLGLGKVDNKDNYKPFADYSTSLSRWLPKLGAVYTPDSGTHVRLAAWQGLRSVEVGDATLAPATLAGMVLTSPSDNGFGDTGQGLLSNTVALGADKQLSPAWLLDMQAQQRKTDFPAIDGVALTQYFLRQQFDEARLALHWQPQGKPWVVSLALDDERLRFDPVAYRFDTLADQHLRSQQLSMRWFASAQWTANLQWSHNQVELTQHAVDSTFTELFLTYPGSFNQVDAELNYQFNKSLGSLTAGVRNATNAGFQYTEIDKLNQRFGKGRLIHAGLKLRW